MKFEDLPKAYEPKEHEEEIYRIWENSGFFNPDALPNSDKRKPFSLMMAPPNVTGHIHVGHAMENTMSDVLVRLKRMQGFKPLFLPGKDHAGIAGQHVVEKELKKEGKSRTAIGREKFVERVWDWMDQYGSDIDQELKRLGLSVDWSRKRFTMDEGYQKAVEEVFIHYHKKGYIYRGKRVVNWCTRCQTTISDLEVEYKEEKGNFYEIKYGPLTIGTVRPETKLGDTALAVHPDDERYKEYHNKEIEIESVDNTIPRNQPPKKAKINLIVIPDEEADPGFGTGVIKVTPAHSMADFEIYERHPEVPVTKIIDEFGKMNENAGARYQGLKVNEAREQIVKDLDELGLLIKTEEYDHSVSHCERCGAIIEPLLSNQWYVSMKELAGAATKAIKKDKIEFIPPTRKKVMLDWIDNIRDWNISRQLWWGHRIPAWHCACTEPEWHISHTKPDTPCKKCKKTWKQTEDVLDTWFSSGLWTFVTLGWPDKTEDLETFYPTALISSAREIFFLWIFRMIFSGIEFMGEPPFKVIYTHPTILDSQGKKMSKSKGNVVDPMKLIDEVGIDATRFGLVWQVMSTQDIQWSLGGFRTGKKFLNKLWNSWRFIYGQLGDGEYTLERPKVTLDHTKKIIAEYDETTGTVNNMLEKLEFGAALHELYDFYWHHFCDIFLEGAKKDDSDETRQTLIYVFAGCLKQLHPFIPFITEYIWSLVPLQKKTLLIVEEV
ncbi:MAG: valine--tRNA ligase [bacterium]|nr:valine--tRNA ligase [bacterium]